MTLILGTNVGHTDEHTPGPIADLGLNTIRLVLTKEHDNTDYVNDCLSCGVEVMGVIAKESIGTMTFAEAAEYYTLEYPNVKYWQLANEADHVSDSSWTMSKTELNSLFDAFVPLIRARVPGAKIIGPGLVSGQPDYLDGVDLSGIDYIAIHPYAQWPTTVGNLLESYHRFERPIIITEFGWPEPNWDEQGKWFWDFINALYNEGVVGIINYCWDDEQNPNFGIVRNGTLKPAAIFFQRFAQQHSGQPQTQDNSAYKFVLGFARAHDSNPNLIGEAVENEFGGIPGASQQLTTTGMLSWMDLKQGDEILFYEFNTGKRYRWNVDHMEPLN